MLETTAKMCKIFRAKGNGIDIYATASELGEQLGATASYIHELSKRDQKLHGKYEITDTGRKERREFVRKKRIRVKKPPRLSPFEEVLLNIKMYGNCYTLADPCGYLPDLYDKGYDCTYREATTMDGFVIEVRNYL